LADTALKTVNLAFRHLLSSHVCASLDQVQVAGLLGLNSAAAVRRIQLCNQTLPSGSLYNRRRPANKKIWWSHRVLWQQPAVV